MAFNKNREFWRNYKRIMCENTKQENEIQKDGEETEDESCWSEDQKRRKYYYDDAHGYEVYKDDEDDLDS